ncbi:succinate semialdehyde dehydrogenase [Pseudarthrobacter phenanthrenivorans Sphe3]|uniref:Succinate semialdehyde dehydrogenase n=1 Tax=Pseudarthrobacter phenanthrenivorans (strain DSM 18606 / JCM 16027 / LMG 23796 / Sphe3) TaxID=930171 RepID=F0M4L7_PSEPM|nr:NAD-dependent succinate-semialdehyde dehydrogenase [Pseudarthrobacter phenanthrenivorans]ADX74564.1 succinate semialdehyde dehydrogenase [Pseudarthrobacter phenanthrenivorans Sphe3]
MTTSIDAPPARLLIGSEWVDSTDGNTFAVYNPSNEEVLAEVADASETDAVEALVAAKAAAAAWSTTPARIRSDILLSAFHRIIERREELAGLISLENGKSLKDARAEVCYAAEYFRWYAEEAVRLRGELFENPTGTNRVLVSYEPVGICVLVTPWNFPAAMATRKIGPALAAGCTAILKPAAETPLTALKIAEILLEAGLPPGVLNVLPTSNAGTVVNSLLEDDDVRLLSFTGSTEVGRMLLARASGKVLKTAMELGGNAPFIVLDDADLEEAVDGAMIAKMRNGGQACTAANRFYVHRSLHDRFVESFVSRLRDVQVADGFLEDTQCGPLINSEAVTKVHGLVVDAITHGAECVLGGAPLDRKGHFYPPTLLVNVPENADILKEEVFGPVVSIVAFDTDAEAVVAANATQYGLVSYLYTGNLERGLRMCGELEAGMIALNRGLVSDPSAPFGGIKQSGLGREGSREGLLEYVEAKYVATNW